MSRANTAIWCNVNPITGRWKMPTKREIQEHIKSTRNYEIAKWAWQCFLNAHADECDMDGVIDTIADGVVEIYLEEYPSGELAEQHWEWLEPLFMSLLLSRLIWKVNAGVGLLLNQMSCWKKKRRE
jgi:hypothetical protein